MRPDQDAMRYLQLRADLIAIDGPSVRANPYREDESPDRWLAHELHNANITAAVKIAMQEQLSAIQGKLITTPGVLLLPSVALFLLGAALYWVVIGFKREES